MKHDFTTWRHLDPAPTDTKGAIVELIEKNHKQTTEQIEGVKAANEKAINDAKTEIKNDFEQRITEAKGTAQKALESVEEARKEFATVKAFKETTPTEKSLEQALIEAVEAKHDDILKFGRGEIKSMELEIPKFDQKAVGTVTVSNVTGTTNWGAQARNGIIMNQNTLTHVRSLLPVRPIGPGTDYYFMKENGAGEGAPAAVAEGATKAQFDVDLVESSVKVETIAGWMLATRKAMNNIPGFLGFLQARLPEKLMDVEDAQILYGNGTTPNLKGILTAGNFTAGSAAGATPLVEKIINDLSTLEDTYKRNATGIVMRPADYYGFFKNKASGSGEYDLPQGVVFVNGVLYILGVPVAKTTALTANDYVVGDFVRGAELLVQEGMRLEFAYEDSDNFRKNLVTIRIEETVALPVYGSDYFLKGSSATA